MPAVGDFLAVAENRLIKIRIDSCIATLLEIHEFLERKGSAPQLKSHFRKLRATVDNLNYESINESDLVRIENATNRMLEELTFLFDEQERGALSPGKHRH